ncbi:SMI1/KNR4 family protein [Bacillus wiedmannii]|uniref:Knr4/Smi1-like domain-containing protein n=1 Tax=Bacillus wiedmannii TaxID=1890302 RepID=A0ABX5DTI5_9BACI|nr:SMI1/KNR4 family protein [Bacillus wiedmannii]PRT04484.1 hypothetical protein C6356_15375 [Bacillus wiedmannii]PRT40156.1 hypothetical protein C6357_16145 [Bacillus wiedmannii]
MSLINLIKALKKTQAKIAEISPTFYTVFLPNPPATESELLSIQQSSHNPLPEDYLELLAICNGWRGMFSFHTHLLSVKDQRRPDIKRIIEQFYEQQAEWTEKYPSDEIFPIAVSTLGKNNIIFIHFYEGRTKYVYVTEDLTVFCESPSIRDFLFSHLEFTIKNLENEKNEPLEDIIRNLETISIRTRKDLQEITEENIRELKCEETLDRIIAILFYQKEIVDLPLPKEFLPNQVIGRKASYYWRKRWETNGDPFDEQEAKVYRDRLLMPYSSVQQIYFLKTHLASLGWNVKISYYPYQCVIRIGNEVKSTIQGDSTGEVLCKAAILTYLKEFKKL